MSDNLADISIDEWVKKLDPMNQIEVHDNAISFHLKSRSMTPIARADKDEITAIRVNADHINRFDIVLFYNETLGYVCHRVVRILDNGIVTMGDANTYKDIMIPKNAVLGKVVHIQRGNWSINTEGMIWRFYGFCWYHLRFVRIPLMRLIYIVPKVKKLIKGKE